MIKKTLQLKHEFSESEINEIAHTLTNCIQQKAVVNLEKSQANKTFNANIKYWEKHINDNTELISTGYEYRDTACEVKYNTPLAGQKTIIRLDTFESWEEPMDLNEFDLFTSNNVPVDFEGAYEALVKPIRSNLLSENQEEE
jgi:hypothetical protein